MSEKPLISVIIPAYNASQFIAETLDSVFAQTFTDFEVVLINDGSPDTEALERALQSYPSNLRYIKQENQGAAAARNTGLRSANGEFIAFLDADDTWLPEFLEKQMEFLTQSDADFVFCDALLVGEPSLEGRTFMQMQPSRGAVTPENLLSLEVTVLTSTVVARKAPILEVGLFDDTIRRGHDFDRWLRLAKLGIRFAYHCDVLAHHRIVESGLSGGTISQLERTLAVLEAIKAKGLTPSEQQAMQFNMNRTLRELALENGKEKLIDRDFPGARKYFNEARKFRHSWKLLLVCLALRISPDFLRHLYRRRLSEENGYQEKVAD
jgi:glycosyltransferase involved in cell wall biosynthesis